MPDILQGIRSITSWFDKTNRSAFFNHLSNAPSPPTPCLLSTTINCISKIKATLPHFGKADSHDKERVWVVIVSQQSETLQLKISYTTTDAGTYSDRCIQGLRTVFWGIRKADHWPKKEQDLLINQLELLVIKFVILAFTKMRKMSAIHNQVENMAALSY